MARGPPESEDCPRVDGMPVLGLGTYRNDVHEACARSVETALETGYRHVDTAGMYRNERAVGEALRSADVEREDCFVATKVWHDRLAPRDVVRSVDESLERLGLSYLDLLYVHWPANTYEARETLAAFDDLHDDGVTDRVGLANFTPALMEEARDVLDASIAALQVELHPLLPQPALRDYCADRGIPIVAYAPLARGAVLDVPEITAVAERHGATAAQVSLAWLRELGATAIPKATGESHIRENWESLSLSLDPEDLDRVNAIDREERLVSPPFAPWSVGA